MLLGVISRVAIRPVEATKATLPNGDKSYSQKRLSWSVHQVQLIENETEVQRGCGDLFKVI